MSLRKTLYPLLITGYPDMTKIVDWDIKKKQFDICPVLISLSKVSKSFQYGHFPIFSLHVFWWPLLSLL